MIMFLVLVRCGMDDIPTRIFLMEQQAEDFAKELTIERVQGVARGIFSLDTSVFYGVDVVRFEVGVPVSNIRIKNFN